MTADDARILQAGVWREQRAIGVQWKITDFVTLGSPLAHAPFPDGQGPRGRSRKESWTASSQSVRRHAKTAGTTSTRRSLLEVTPPGATCRLRSCSHHRGAICLQPAGRICFFPWRSDSAGRSITLGELIKEPKIRVAPHVVRIPDTGDVDERAHEELRKALDLDAWWTPENTENRVRGAGGGESEAFQKTARHD